jgi:hypothetical protein
MIPIDLADPPTVMALVIAVLLIVFAIKAAR